MSFWRTGVVVLLGLVFASGLAMADSRKTNRATLALQGTVYTHADVEIQPMRGTNSVVSGAFIDTRTNMTAGYVVSFVVSARKADAGLSINDTPVDFAGRTISVISLDGTRSHRSKAVAMTWSQDSIEQVMVDVAAP